jgi:hypothetical protein
MFYLVWLRSRVRSAPYLGNLVLLRSDLCLVKVLNLSLKTIEWIDGDSTAVSLLL